tara:strand:- start:115 stop:1875 length:1761 start_codon:yes stop_codon:yes gene_type:complete
MFSYITNLFNKKQEVVLDKTHFKLPITYINSDNLYKITDVVSNDLELISNTDSNNENLPIYEHLLQSTNIFGKQNIPLWNEYFTNDIHFLTDTQNIIKKLNTYNTEMKSIEKPNYDTIIETWNEVKNDEYFLQKYNYMDWDMLKHLNNSSKFLQIISIIHLLSPVISLIIPIIMLIIPFVLLKLQGVNISLTTYIDTLKFLGKNHFIGKMLSSENLTPQNIIYMFMMFGFYIFQVYQNITICLRFYNNINKINNHLIDFKHYINYSIHSMDTFLKLTDKQDTYIPFCNDIKRHCNYLYNLKQHIHDITTYTKFQKINNIGYLLKCYYLLFANSDFENGINYSMKFEGYIDNLNCIYEHHENKVISFANYDNVKEVSFKKQYYPALVNEKHVKNDCILNKNMIISAPNKGGKTTILKTTAINIIFSQQFGCGFYESADIIPFTHIHSYINIPDTSGRDSLFQAESRRCKDIIDIISTNNNKHNHFCIFDELYSGTNPIEAAQAGTAFLQYLQQFNNVKFMLTTHYISICKKYKNSPHIQNYKMDVEINDDDTFVYKYKLKKGISKIKGAVRVLKDLNYPDEIIKNIK